MDFDLVQWHKYILSAYKTRTDYIVFGRPSVFNGRINIAHPDVDKADELRLNTMGLQPYYTTTDKMKRAGLNSRSIEHFTATLFERLDAEIPETLPPYLVSALNLVSLDEALRHVHYPTSAEDLRKAQFRLKFEELFYIQNFDYDKKAGLNTMISSLYHYGLFDQIECEQGGANYVLSDFAKALKSSSLNFDEGFYTEKRILTYNDIKPLNIAEPLSWENLDGGSY